MKKTDEQVNKTAYMASFTQYGDVRHEEYESTANGYIMGYNDAVNDIEPKWVDVNEMLPNDTDYVLIYTLKQKLIKKGFFMLKDQWDRPNMFCAEMGFFSVNDITHWMPLPQPPKEY